MTAPRTCRTCRFVDILLEVGALPNGHPHFPVAICRRHPPRPMVSHRSHGANFIRGKFPPVDPDKDWCGEWKGACGAQTVGTFQPQ
jgi:hypothetical protein